MTRRKFIQKLIKAGSAIAIGASWLARKATPRKFIRAVPLKKYPGSVKSLRDVCKQGRWSG